MAVFLSLRRWTLSAALLLVAGIGLASAQSSVPPATDAQPAASDDPPDRAARLSWLGGDVGLLPAGAQDWSDASLNRPLTRGDRLSTGDDARAELELDGTTLRIDHGTDFGFLELSDQLGQVELTQGTLNLAVRHLDDGQSYEIDTPTVALVVDQPGTFRVDVDKAGGSTRVTAWDGSATVYGEGGAQRLVVAGRSYRFDDSTLNAVMLTDVDGGDAFDAWCNDRDQRYAASPTSRYVSNDVIGYQDLDRYGDWRSDPDYGQVWYPDNVSDDWAPYRDGHWAYVAPWGWSWVDDAPWGFAPYHYGRWAQVRGAWGWVPGPVAVRPIYAPALVVFAGGAGWNLSIGSAPIGWFPLGPGEIYDPWYRGSRRYFTQINITNIYGYRHHRHDIDHWIDRDYDRYHRGLPPVRAEHYAHRNEHGFTAMRARDFADARPVRRARLHLDARQLARAPVLGRAATPKPTPRSRGPVRHAGALPTAGFQRAVVSRHTPPTLPGARRVAFAPAHAAARNPGADRAGPRRVSEAGHPAARLPHVPVVSRAGRPAREQAARRETAAPRGVVAGTDRLRPGELRSARFAPSHVRQLAEEPRPARATATVRTHDRPPARGLPPATHAAPARAADTHRALPRVPRFERAAPSSARARPSTPHAAPDPAARLPQPPRFEPRRAAGASMRAPDFRAPHPAAAPVRLDAPPRGYRPPHGNGPPRPMPQRAPSSSRPAPHAAPRAASPRHAAPPVRAAGNPYAHDKRH